jgi:hypothetical protein
MSVKIDIVVNAEGAIRSVKQLEEALEAANKTMREAETEEEMLKSAQAVGVLTDQLNDMNKSLDRAKVGEETFRKVGRSMESMGDNLLKMNFKGVQQDINNMATDIKGFKWKEFTAGLKGAAVSSWNFTMSLLANPVGAIVAGIVALIAVLALVLNYFGMLNPIIDKFNEILDGAIALIGKFTDALGLTTNAYDKFAEDSVAALEENSRAHAANVADIQAANEEIITSLNRELEVLEAKGASEEQIAAKRKELLDADLAGKAKIAEEDAKQEVRQKKIADGIREQTLEIIKQKNRYVDLAGVQAEIDRLRSIGDEEGLKAFLEKNKLNETQIELLTKSMDKVDESTEQAKKSADEKSDAEHKVTVNTEKENTKRVNNAKKAEEERLKAVQDRVNATIKLEETLTKLQDDNAKKEIDLALAGTKDEQKASELRVKAIENEFKMRSDANTKAAQNTLEAEIKLREDLAKVKDPAQKAEIEKQLAANQELQEALKVQNALNAQEELQKIGEEKDKQNELKKQKEEAWIATYNDLVQTEGEKINTERQKALDAAEKAFKDSGSKNEQELVDAKKAINEKYNKELQKLAKDTGDKLEGFDKEAYNARVWFSQKSIDNAKEAEKAKVKAAEEAALEKIRIAQELMIAEQGEGAKTTEEYQALEAQKAAIKEEALAKIKALEDFFNGKSKISLEEGLQMAAEGIAMLSSIQQAATETKLNNLNAEKEAAIQAAGDDAAARERIEKEFAAKEDAIKKKQFERDKKTAIAQALIQGALLVMKTLAELGPIVGPIVAAAMGAVTLAQVAAISSQKYQGGGGGGGSVPSPRTSGGGGAAPQPSFSFFGTPNQGSQQGTQNNMGGSEGTQQPLNVNVSISETEVTSAQNRVRQMENNATL